MTPHYFAGQIVRTEIGTIMFLGGLLLGHLSGYTTLVASRGRDDLTAYHSGLRAFLGGLAMLATLGMYVWGFAYRAWWIPPLAFLGLGLVAVPILYGGHRARELFWHHYRAQPAYDGGAAICAGLLWWAAIVW